MIFNQVEKSNRRRPARILMVLPIGLVNSSGHGTDLPTADATTIDVRDRHDSACRRGDEDLVGCYKMSCRQHIGACRDAKLGADVENGLARDAHEHARWRSDDGTTGDREDIEARAFGDLPPL